MTPALTRRSASGSDVGHPSLIDAGAVGQDGHATDALGRVEDAKKPDGRLLPGRTLDVAASRLDRAQTNDAPAADPRELYMNGTPVAALPPGLLDSPLQVRRGA